MVAATIAATVARDEMNDKAVRVSAFSLTTSFLPCR